MSLNLGFVDMNGEVKNMNSKMKGVFILGLVLVAALASTFVFSASAANQTRDRIQDQVQDCDCINDGTCDGASDQTRDRTQDQIQDRTCDGVADQTCDRTRDQVQDQNCAQDCNCDGVLQGGNNGAELALFLHNYTYHQSCAPTPDCGGESLMGGGMEESAMFAGAGEGLEDGLEAAVDDSEPVDTAALAAWLAEQLTPEQLAAFMADATTAAQGHADDGIGADIMELLTYLP